MKKRYILTLAILTTVVLSSALTGSPVRAQTPENVAVLPFTIHSDKNLDYVKQGICRMFYSRLSWRDRVTVIPPEKMKSIHDRLGDLSASQQIKAVSDRTGSQYVVSGTITQLAGSFSIDARVYDIDNKRYMAFFEQSKKSDDLIPKVDRIAASINHRVFERTTVTWEQMEQEKQKYLNDLKRKNPEHLMQVPQGWQSEEEVGWKVWKYLF